MGSGGIGIDVMGNVRIIGYLSINEQGILNVVPPGLRKRPPVHLV